MNEAQQNRTVNQLLRQCFHRHESDATLHNTSHKIQRESDTIRCARGLSPMNGQRLALMWFAAWHDPLSARCSWKGRSTPCKTPAGTAARRTLLDASFGVVCCAFVRCALCVVCVLVSNVWVLACVLMCWCWCWCWCVTLTPPLPPSPPSHPSLPCLRSKRPPCVHSKRPRVYWHHARKCYHMRAWCLYTRGRFECTHGVFSVPHHTARTDHDHNDIHNNNTTTTTTTTHGETGTDRDRDRERQRETERDRERDRERRQRKKTEKERQKERQDKTRREKRR